MTALFTSISFEESTLKEYDTVTPVKWLLTLWRTAVHFQRVSRSKKNGFLNCTATKISKLVSPHLMLHNFNSWYTEILIIEKGITSTLTIRNDKKKFRDSELQFKMNEGDSCAMHIKLYMYMPPGLQKLIHICHQWVTQNQYWHLQPNYLEPN